MSFLERGMDSMYDHYGRVLKDAERKSRETGRELTDEYYETKRKYEQSRAHYEDLKNNRR